MTTEFEKGFDLGFTTGLSLATAVNEAGGGIGAAKLDRMTARELLCLLGRNNIEFAHRLPLPAKKPATLRKPVDLNLEDDLEDEN